MKKMKFRFFEELKELLRNKTKEMTAPGGSVSEILSWYDDQEETIARLSGLSDDDLEKISCFARFQVRRAMGCNELGY